MLEMQDIENPASLQDCDGAATCQKPVVSSCPTMEKRGPLRAHFRNNMPSEEIPDPIPAGPCCKITVTHKAQKKRKILHGPFSPPEQNAEIETRNSEVEDAAPVADEAKPAGGTQTTASFDQPGFQLNKPIHTASRYDTSLGLLTRRFAEMVNRTADGIIDLNLVCMELNVRKRRVYDVTNVLEGVRLVTKPSKNHIKWLGYNPNEKITQELQVLMEAEQQLDELIDSCVLQIYQMQEEQRFAYLTYDDIQSVPDFKDQTVIVIKAPAETKLEVPHPTEGLQVHLRSGTGPIDVFICSDGPVLMNNNSCVSKDSCSHSSTNADPAAPLSPNSSHPKATPPDDGNHPPTITTSSPVAKSTQHTLPAAAVVPPSS